MLYDVREHKMVSCRISVGRWCGRGGQIQPVFGFQKAIKPALLQREWTINTKSSFTGSFLHTVSVIMVILRLEVQRSEKSPPTLNGGPAAFGSRYVTNFYLRILISYNTNTNTNTNIGFGYRYQYQ